MAYDFHGGWDPVTGHNSPMYARPNENDEQKTLNVDYAVKYWLNKGCPADKLILGCPRARGHLNSKGVRGRKVEYLIKMNLGGAMVWSIETDDFRGRCHGYANPLLRAINSALGDSSSPQPDLNINPSNKIPLLTSTMPLPTTKAYIPKTTVNNKPPEVTTNSVSLPCSRNGYFRHPDNCKAVLYLSIAECWLPSVPVFVWSWHCV
ncbi:chitotriosidase-1 [Caerostris extrusa]|uniref:Chitotriosidase-1 n=1 Tax=Caerostris extrusa TaxID=172846 RepID=A0AAV4MGK6_CAEEX|nr:chitotriosidase-1 [Caerostris extrusa]